MYSPQISSHTCLFLFTALTFLTGPVSLAVAQSPDGLPLPPGEIVTGLVYRGKNFPPAERGTSFGPITNGVDANAFLEIPAPTLPYLNSVSSPARVVLTSVPTQYVRFYLPCVGTNNPAGCGGQQGSWVVGSNEVRGLTPAQIRDRMALPAMPTMETLYSFPAGTCILVGTAGPILGNFSANPPAIPTPGPWGHGGVIQEFIVGNGCGPGTPGYAGTPFNAQPIGAYALAYVPRAGSGNAGAIAYALDHATLPALFTPMDSIYTLTH